MSRELKLKVFPDLPSHVEMEGSSSALRDLADWIRTATGDATSIPVVSATVRVVWVRRTDSLVQIGCSSDSLSIEGAREKLEVLAENIEYVASSAADSNHIHIEYYQDHPYLAAESMPLVISCSGEA